MRRPCLRPLRLYWPRPRTKLSTRRRVRECVARAGLVLHVAHDYASSGARANIGGGLVRLPPCHEGNRTWESHCYMILLSLQPSYRCGHL